MKLVPKRVQEFAFKLCFEIKHCMRFKKKNVGENILYHKFDMSCAFSKTKSYFSNNNHNIYKENVFAIKRKFNFCHNACYNNLK